MDNLRIKIINTAAYLAQQEMERKGKGLKEVLAAAIDEACEIHEADRKAFIK